MEPLVSIITPTYNHEKYIGQCIESVLRQSFASWEMIIVDDASSDKTCEAVQRYCGKDGRISLIRHAANYGPRRLKETHNEALAKAKGTYITVLEGDDYWPPYRLEMQVPMFDDPAIVLCHGQITAVYDNRLLPYLNCYDDEVRRNDPSAGAMKHFLLCENPILATSVMVRKETLLKIGGFQQTPSLYLVDFPTWMSLALEGRFAFIDTSLGYWRRHQNSITLTCEEELWRGFADHTAAFAAARRDQIISLDGAMRVYCDNNSYNAYQALCSLYLSTGRPALARKMVKELLKRRKIALKDSHWLRLLLLLTGAYVSPVIYTETMKAYGLLRGGMAGNNKSFEELKGRNG